MNRQPGAWILVNEETGEVKPDINDSAMAERIKINEPEAIASKEEGANG